MAVWLVRARGCSFRDSGYERREYVWTCRGHAGETECGEPAGAACGCEATSGEDVERRRRCCAAGVVRADLRRGTCGAAESGRAGASSRIPGERAQPLERDRRADRDRSLAERGG